MCHVCNSKTGGGHKCKTLYPAGELKSKVFSVDGPKLGSATDWQYKKGQDLQKAVKG